MTAASALRRRHGLKKSPRRQAEPNVSTFHGVRKSSVRRNRIALEDVATRRSSIPDSRMVLSTGLRLRAAAGRSAPAFAVA